VHFSHSGWITDATLAVYAHCPLLEAIVLAACLTNCTAAGVRHVVEHCNRKLCELDLSNCTQLYNDVVSAVAQHCPLLRKFQSPPHISERLELAVGRPEVTSTFGEPDRHRGQCHRTKSARHALQGAGGSFVSGCKKLTEHGVRMLVANCVQLRSLWVPQPEKTHDGSV
jgi:hypothetical protein